MSTSTSDAWKLKEKGDEARYIHEKEQAQLKAIRDKTEIKDTNQTTSPTSEDRNIEGGFGGQEDLEDRYATTSGEH